MHIIDTHLHLIYPDRFAYPWLAGVPAIYRAFTVDAYFAEAEALGIVAALHMEVDVAPTDSEAETRFMAGLDPRIVGAIAACRPEDPNFAAELGRLIAIPGVRGLRRILHQAPDDVSTAPLFAENIRRLAAVNLSFDLCLLARQLPLGLALAKACPDVAFVLDHCGNPPIASGDLAAWRADIADLAALPNVAAKISGIANHAPAGWSAGDLRPVVEHVIESFGWDRVVWGSDHPVLTLAGDLGAWVEATRAIVSGCSSDEQTRLFSRNAGRIYGAALPG